MKTRVILALSAFLLFLAGSLPAGTVTGSALGLTALGFVDIDGAELEAVAIEYDRELCSEDVCPEAFIAPRRVVEAYVSDSPAMIDTGTGRYVILVLEEALLAAAEESFLTTMSVEVEQARDIASNGALFPAVTVRNYIESEAWNGFRKEWVTVRTPVWGTYRIRGIEGFRFYTDLDTFGEPDGPSFKAEGCFSEIDGSYHDEALSYALFVPEDYNPEGRYGLVTIENPAASEGTHPLQSILETRSPALMASEWAQALVREKHGLDGLIVVMPTVTERVDDNGCAPAQYEAIVRLWDSLIEEYAIDTDYVYGMGQSVGGMILMETNRNRDNFFSGVIMFENQWVQNYYKDMLFSRNIASDPAVAASAPMHYPRTDGYITWDWHYENGEKVFEGHDPYNFYYLVSDDNVLVMNRGSNNLSNGTWQELSYLYQDLAGIEIPHLHVDASAPVREEEEAIDAFLATESPIGIRIVTFDGGANGYSARKVLSGYEWLLSQSRPQREKLDINKPFVLAETQLDRPVASYTDLEGNTVNYKTAAKGSGTQLYNTSWMNLVTVLDAEPGWLPGAMSWEKGVELSSIVSVSQEGNEVKIVYSADMTGSVVRLKGDAITGTDGEVREDLSYAIDPFDFYGEDGGKLEASIRGVEAEGNMITLSLDSDVTVSSIVQRATIRADRAIASALSRSYPLT